jgi:hypothetical protein
VAAISVRADEQRREATLVTTSYTIQTLIKNMPATLKELAAKSGVSDRSVMRVRDGEKVARSTANKVLKGLSDLYGKTFTLENVTGIEVVDRK